MASRSLNPAPLYPQAPSGFMYYYKAGTTTPIDTYADLELTIKNAWPVPLSATGLLPNVFVDGSRKQILRDKDLNLIWERDNVGVDSTLGQFEEWDALVIYDVNDLVVGSDGKFYRSFAALNQGNDPTTPSPTKWEEIVLRGIYNANISYSIGNVVQDSNGLLWRSLTNGNIGNTPSTDDGTNWEPAVDIDNIVSGVWTVVPQTGGGTLTARRVNELRDGNTYLFPLASSVAANETIVIDLPSKYSANQPKVQRTSSDLIEDINGTDTEIQFVGSARVYATSDGVSKWII